MFSGSRAIPVCVLLLFLLLGSGCATTPDPQDVHLTSSISASEAGMTQTSAAPGKSGEPDRSYGRKEDLLISSIRNELDGGRPVRPEQAARLIELMPDSSYAGYLAGLIYLSSGDLENARIELARSHELDQANDHALSALGDIALQTGDLTGADLYYSKAHEAAGTPETANRLALLRIQGGYLESARDILAKTLSDHPDDAMTRNNLAIAMDMMGTASEGIDILSSDEITDPRLLSTRALLHLKEGRPDRAATDLETGFETASSAGKWLLMGIADLQRGKLEQAEERFRAALAAEPSGYEGYLNLGLTLRRQGRFSEAEKVYLEGLARAPYPDLHMNLGILYELYRGEPSLALVQYRQYVELGGPASDRVRGWAEYLEGVVENR
jgi:tetratricopeptide (TPR) repeat protein